MSTIKYRGQASALNEAGEVLDVEISKAQPMSDYLAWIEAFLIAERLAKKKWASGGNIRMLVEIVSETQP